MNESIKILISFVFFRITNLLLNQTWFAPDEYWQSQEVAHRLAFNYGYLTWEWKVGLRSYAYPFSISIIYKLLQILNLDQTILIIYTIPFLHCILTSIGDFLFYIHVKRVFGNTDAFLASSMRCLSWFTIYTSSRSLTNNLEELFSIIVMFCLSGHRLVAFNSFAFLAFCVRPTAAINLIPIYFYAFFFTQKKSKLEFIRKFCVVGLVVISMNTLVDSYFHARLLVSPYNFLHYNVFNNVGVHYGTHAWHWYLTQGIPILLFTHLIVFVVGGLASYKRVRFELAAISFNIFVYSLLSHKEFRFLSQTMPFAMIVCAFGLKRCSSILSMKKCLGLLAISNLCLVFFVGIVHQRGPISVMKRLRNLDLNETTESILFLTPCHSTPYYSFLHRNVSMRFLTCEPNLEQNKADYLDEADRFYIEPEKWFEENLKTVEKATRLVIYDDLYKKLSSSKATNFFTNRFHHCERFYHSPIKQSDRIGKFILLCSSLTFENINISNQSAKIEF